MQAVEVSARIDQNGNLTLLKPLKIRSKKSVRVIVLIPDEADISEEIWLKTASTNPVFEFLHDADEDIYSMEDGKPMAAN